MTTNSLWSDVRGMNGGQALEAASRLLPPWISLVLIVVIGWQLANMFWALMPGSATGDTIVAAPDSGPFTVASSRAVDVQSLASAHLFGEASREDEPQVAPTEVTEDLPDTRLTNLSLKGTIASDVAEDSAAIIADGGNKEQVYAIGDAVTSGAKLHAVYSNRVVLNENGTLTSLELPKDFPQGTTPPTRRVTQSTQRAARDQSSIQNVVAQNIATLADVIRPTPYLDKGQMVGYRVYPGRDRRQFAALGLRPGDLVKDIDGQSLTDPQQAMKIFQSLGNADQVSVTVERNGQPTTLILKTSQLELGDEETQ